MASAETINPQAVKALKRAVKRLTSTKRVDDPSGLRTGVDLGTASIIVAVLDTNQVPVATELQTAQVARDGLVVDYVGAVDIVTRLVTRLNERLGVELKTAAIAMPPGVSSTASHAHRHVVEASGLTVSHVVDEPTAAGTLLGITDGVVVDIGGGTTGLSVFRDGKVVYVADEPTGGTHVSLVLMGRYKLSFEEAETMKLERPDEVRQAVLPVMHKMAGIVKRHLEGHDRADEVYLVGGTSNLKGIDSVFAETLDCPVFVPPHPMMVTPVGIALNDTGPR